MLHFGLREALTQLGKLNVEWVLHALVEGRQAEPLAQLGAFGIHLGDFLAQLAFIVLEHIEALARAIDLLCLGGIEKGRHHRIDGGMQVGLVPGAPTELHTHHVGVGDGPCDKGSLQLFDVLAFR